jgi:hypothetical protein
VGDRAGSVGSMNLWARLRLAQSRDERGVEQPELVADVRAVFADGPARRRATT